MAYTNIGTLLVGKDDPSTRYIKINESVTLPKGVCISVKKPEEQMADLLKAHNEGKIDDEKFKARAKNIEAIPKFVVANLFYAQKD